MLGRPFAAGWEMRCTATWYRLGAHKCRQHALTASRAIHLEQQHTQRLPGESQARAVKLRQKGAASRANNTLGVVVAGAIAIRRSFSVLHVPSAH
jgi:hypothetical protein